LLSIRLAKFAGYFLSRTRRLIDIETRPTEGEHTIADLVGASDTSWRQYAGPARRPVQSTSLQNQPQQFVMSRKAKTVERHKSQAGGGVEE
jgi:hypothetical protein